MPNENVISVPVGGPIGEGNGIVQPLNRSFQVAGWGQVNKYVRRIVDLPAIGATPTKISLGLAGEVRLYSDFPVYVAVEDPGNLIGPISELTYRGDIKQLYVARGPAYNFGRLVVYTARPYFGASFRRESWEGKASVDIGLAVFAITTPNASADSASVPVPGPGNQPFEAYYVRSITYLREGGDVSTIAFEEDESGASYNLWRFRPQDPSNMGTVFLQHPFRISATGHFRVGGSIEAGDTNVTLRFNAVLI